MSFAESFIRLCEIKGVTQAQVARDLDLSQSTVASWKSRGLTPNGKTLEKLAVYFGVSVSVLLYGLPDNYWEDEAGEPHSEPMPENSVSIPRLDKLSEAARDFVFADTADYVANNDKSKKAITKEELKAALFAGTEVSDDVLQEVLTYAEYLMHKHKRDGDTDAET